MANNLYHNRFFFLTFDSILLESKVPSSVLFSLFATSVVCQEVEQQCILLLAIIRKRELRITNACVCVLSMFNESDCCFDENGTTGVGNA